MLLLLPVLVLALAGCGSSSSSSSPAATSGNPLDAVSITGDVGTKPQVEWKDKFTATDVQTTTLTKGDGDTIAEGDQVQAQIWIGNGFSQKEAYSTYDQGGAADPDPQRPAEPGLLRRHQGRHGRIPDRGQRARRQAGRVRAATPTSASGTRTRCWS